MTRNTILQVIKSSEAWSSKKKKKNNKKKSNLLPKYIEEQARMPDHIIYVNIYIDACNKLITQDKTSTYTKEFID